MLPALVTRVWVDTMRLPHVVAEALFAGKPLVALTAGKGPFPRMHSPPMLLQGRRSGETLAAIIALTGLLSCVRPVVGDQEAFVQKPFTAINTLKRRFT